MKKFALLLVALLAVLNPSLGNTTQSRPHVTFHSRSVLKTPTRTKNVSVSVLSRTQKRILIAHHIIDDDENDDLPGSDELDVHVSYRKPDAVEKRQKPYDDDEELSEYVQIRLLVARARALAKYKELYG